MEQQVFEPQLYIDGKPIFINSKPVPQWAGESASAFNQWARKEGEQRINPLTAPENYSSLWGNLWKNAKEGAAGFSTMLGTAISPFAEANRRADDIYNQAMEYTQQQAAREGREPTFMEKERVKIAADELRRGLRNEAFLNAVQSEKAKRAGLGIAGGAMAGSAMAGGPGALAGALAGLPIGLLGGKGTADAVLDTYNTSVDELRKGTTRWEDVVQGIMDNPLWAGMDIASLGGADAVGKALTKAGDAVSNIKWGAELGISKDARNFSRNVSQVSNNSRAQQSGLYNVYNELMGLDLTDAQRAEIVRDIMTNEGNLTPELKALSNRIKDALNYNASIAYNMGVLDPGEAAKNQVAQYIMTTLPDDTTYLFKDIRGMIDNVASGTRRIEDLPADVAERYLASANHMRNMDTAWLTQALAPSVDPSGIVRAIDFVNPEAGYFATPRIIGRTSVETLAPILEDSIKYQLDQVTKIKEADDLAKFTLDSSKDFKVLEGNIVPDGYITFDAEAYRAELRRQMMAGERTDPKRALRVANTNRQGAILIPKNYAKALENAVTSKDKNAYRDMLNLFKKSALATVHNIAANRIGNITNNAMASVGITDYIDAIRLRNEMPNQLRQQTAFNSYVASGLEDSLNRNPFESATNTYNNIRRTNARYNRSDKSLAATGRYLLDQWNNINDAFADPFFRTESTLERIDRYANIINHAKKYAKENNLTLEEALRNIRNDDKLFNEINTLTNKELGDYVGRNYFLPNWYYDVLGGAVPFYRFITQTGRTTFNQLKNNPDMFQAMMLPGRAGVPVYYDTMETLGLNPEYYSGGAYYYNNPNGSYATVGVEPLPALAVLSQTGGFLGGDDMEGMLSPIPSTFADIIRYRTNKGKDIPVTSRMIKEIGEGRATKENYEPAGWERIMYALHKMGLLTNTLYKLTHTMGPELETTIDGRYLYPQMSGQPFSFDESKNPRRTPLEKIGKYGTIRTNAAFKKSPKAQQKDVKQSVRERNYYIKNLYMNRDPRLLKGGIRYFE